MTSNFALCAIDVGISADDVARMADEVTALPKGFWTRNEHRSCWVASLFDPEDGGWLLTSDRCPFTRAALTMDSTR